MIRLVEDQEGLAELLTHCERNAFGTKIGSLARAYGLEKRAACFWLDLDGGAAFGLTDGLMVISGTAADPEEARAFLSAVGASTVMCALRTAEALDLQVQQTGDVLKKVLPSGPKRLPPETEVNIREVFRLLQETNMVEDFEAFYLDLSHRLRHGEALVCTRYIDDQLAGCAVVSAKSEQTALLSAVAVREAYRRQGIGTELVQEAEAALPGRTMFLFREKDAHRDFYRNLDYRWCDAWTCCVL